MTKEFIDYQLSLAFTHTENSLGCHIEKCLGRSVSLVLTENSTSMLSARVRGGLMHIRLHRMFLGADNLVIDEIIVFLKNRKGNMPHFRCFIRNNRERLSNRLPNKVSVKTQGRFYDLRELFDEINEEYFGGMIESVITWGAKSSRYSVRKRTLGSYSARTDLIRINPVLDKKSIPRYFIAFVVYHEMLHAAIGISRQEGRRRLHSREFKKREMLFGEYERAIAWESRASA